MAQKEPLPNRSTQGPSGGIEDAAWKSILKDFALVGKWFATAARAKKLASVLPKTNSVWGPSAETPRCDRGEDACRTLSCQVHARLLPVGHAAGPIEQLH